MERIRKLFLCEIVGQFQEIESVLETASPDPAYIPMIMRVMHSLKGSAPMMGYEGVAPLAASVESWYKQKMAENNNSFSEAEVGHTLRAVEIIRIRLHSPASTAVDLIGEEMKLVAFFEGRLN